MSTFGTSDPYPRFPKIPRLLRDVVVTEKLDGTNALVHVSETGEVRAGSRTRWITPEVDNFGFARWVHVHEDELRALGEGHHYGEWWGRGIQRGYGLTERRFSLFNVERWREDRPTCCDVVPTLDVGPFDLERIKDLFGVLALSGSVAAPGFMKPEGLVVYHTRAHHLYKVTLDGDGHEE